MEVLPQLDEPTLTSLEICMPNHVGVGCAVLHVLTAHTINTLEIGDTTIQTVIGNRTRDGCQMEIELVAQYDPAVRSS